MRPEPGDVPPDRSARWRVIHVGQRVRWTDEADECGVCERPVSLRRRHHYVTVSPEPSARRRGGDDEEVLFCSVACLEAWGAREGETSSEDGGGAERVDGTPGDDDGREG